MEKTCLVCGKKFFATEKQAKIYCSTKCANFMNRKRPLNIREHFPIFQRIVANATDFQNFVQLYKRFFRLESTM